ncbi:TRF Taz1 [Schizosaccharomyces japonicus yFS275]|uniref:TRF Taz1 n=1 Tax=Schizosaccharomyces japonicus (strain yFS275 / FY16936) TaxID=402676 RepID=B6JYV6_SCHJY|nr:TRF Taz1 [Schizosaccharomyces japonicus yFS275]EEB06724.2 TRF Taz1 [Schizosaccharomyces japonicus yFS275]
MKTRIMATVSNENHRTSKEHEMKENATNSTTHLYGTKAKEKFVDANLIDYEDDEGNTSESSLPSLHEGISQTSQTPGALDHPSRRVSLDIRNSSTPKAPAADNESQLARDSMVLNDSSPPETPSRIGDLNNLQMKTLLTDMDLLAMRANSISAPLVRSVEGLPGQNRPLTAEGTELFIQKGFLLMEELRQIYNLSSGTLIFRCFKGWDKEFPDLYAHEESMSSLQYCTGIIDLFDKSFIYIALRTMLIDAMLVLENDEDLFQETFDIFIDVCIRVIQHYPVYRKRPLDLIETLIFGSLDHLKELGGSLWQSRRCEEQLKDALLDLKDDAGVKAADDDVFVRKGIQYFKKLRFANRLILPDSRIEHAIARLSSTRALIEHLQKRIMNRANDSSATIKRKISETPTNATKKPKNVIGAERSLNRYNEGFNPRILGMLQKQLNAIAADSSILSQREERIRMQIDHLREQLKLLQQGAVGQIQHLVSPTSTADSHLLETNEYACPTTDLSSPWFLYNSEQHSFSEADNSSTPMYDASDFPPVRDGNAPYSNRAMVMESSMEPPQQSKSRKMTGARRPRKTRQRWSAAQEDELFKMIHLHGCSWSKIQNIQKSHDGPLSVFSQVQLKDKARLVKAKYMKQNRLDELYSISHFWKNVTVGQAYCELHGINNHRKNDKDELPVTEKQT